MKATMKAATVLLLLVGVQGSFARNLRGASNEPRSLVPSTRINPRGINYPEFRYAPWCSLNEKTKILAADLTWDSATWDAPGTAKFESQSSFEALIEKSIKKNNTIASSLISMGWTEEIYDCFVNHYEDYDWSDMEQFTDAIPYWKQLGWNSSSWNEDIDYVPDTEEMEWKDLSNEQKAAAVALCYFEEIWSEIEIPSWSEFLHVDVCLVANGTMAINISTAVAAQEDLDIEDEGMPNMPIQVEGEDETEEAAAAPHDEEGEADGQLSSSASGSASSPFSVQVVPANPPADTPTETSEEIAEIQIDAKYVPNPSNRFLLWSWLFESTKEAAATLGFNETTWNAMTAPIESEPFDDLSADQVEASYVLGFAPAEIWDCHINHFSGYNWDELAKAGVQDHYIALGWSFESWSNLRAPPESFGSLWTALTDEQQIAARALCYREPTWNRVNLNVWVV